MFYQVEHIGVPEHLTIEKNKNFSFPPHMHQCFEFIIIHDGCMNVSVDNQVFVLYAGDAALIFPNQIHSLESIKSEHTLCIFSPEFVKAFWQKTSKKLPLNSKFRLEESVIDLFNQLSQNKTEAFKKGILYLICDQFDKNTTYKSQNFDDKSLLYKMFAFVDNNFEVDCSLASLSDKIGYNYSYLSRYFKNAVGISFNSYVNNYRINHACYLLKNSTLPIIQCAFDSGFISLRSFNRNFKEQLGITPIEYRNSNKKQEKT